MCTGKVPRAKEGGLVETCRLTHSEMGLFVVVLRWSFWRPALPTWRSCSRYLDELELAKPFRMGINLVLVPRGSSAE